MVVVMSLICVDAVGLVLFICDLYCGCLGFPIVFGCCLFVD